MARKAKVQGLVEAAANAAEELGRAATAFKESWEHVKSAQEKGRPVTRAVGRAAKNATQATKRTVRRVTRRK